ncbi:expressed unknown protein [Seminavis robusta]|uniref:Uncharacterized protein n=1 Tax=Seminavis robusta TaxID=568900 RepID=A0A9N8HQZ1_9STRA|nr:expressed unknown protein [Seminavis robusta]|eukprot:Sro1207_g252520.1 n/a (305) ;mRNA; f:28449-29363
MDKLAHGRKRPWTGSDYPYQVDYNDHFETPMAAYQDIAPLLDWLGSSSMEEGRGKGRKTLCIYDPYYCDGQTESLFRQLGFEGIINRKRDFYRDIEQKQLPEFDILVTNPPYSDQHKEKCLDFSMEQLRTQGNPFFLLMPSYVASREYFRSRDQKGDVMYLIPSVPYEYTHPEGTGKDVPPFASLWFCGIPRDKQQQLMDHWKTIPWDHGRIKPSLASSWNDLKETGTISTAKRPNPRQRKKRRQHAQSLNNSQQKPASQQNTKGAAVITSNDKKAPSEAPKHKKKQKKSKHRDGDGQRKKKRF